MARLPVYSWWVSLAIRNTSSRPPRALPGSTYAFLRGAWPFGFVEAVWTVVALHRWAKSLSFRRS